MDICSFSAIHFGWKRTQSGQKLCKCVHMLLPHRHQESGSFHFRQLQRPLNLSQIRLWGRGPYKASQPGIGGAKTEVEGVRKVAETTPRMRGCSSSLLQTSFRFRWSCSSPRERNCSRCNSSGFQGLLCEEWRFCDLDGASTLCCTPQQTAVLGMYAQ